MNSLLLVSLLAAMAGAAPRAPAPTPAPTPAPNAQPAPEAAAQPTPPVQRVLHLSDALSEALAHQPTLRQARAQTQSAEARTAQARSGLLPQFTGSTAYQRSTNNIGARLGFVPGQGGGEGHSKFATFNSFNGGLTASQLVYDFGATPDRYRAAEGSARAQREAELATGEQVALNVRVAFFTALGNKALLQVADETLANQRRHLDQIAGFVDVGSRPRLDLVQAQADVANAQVQRIQADNNYATSKVQLNQAMGIEGPADYDLADDRVGELAEEADSGAALVDLALKARPEFAQAAEAIRAQELTVAGLRGSYWPSLGVSTGITYNGTDLPLAVNWNAQATLSWNIFQGGLTRAQVDEAQAQLAVLEAQRDSLRQQVELEVEQARLALVAAKAALGAAEQSLQSSRERLDLAEGRYRAGVGNIIELGDAQLAYTNAAAQRVRAEYTLETARAQLIHALGRR